MATTIGRFGFRVMGGKKAMTNPAIAIVLQTWSEHEGAPCISPNVMSPGEIDEHVQALKADLDAVGKLAKSALAKQN